MGDQKQRRHKDRKRFAEPTSEQGKYCERWLSSIWRMAISVIISQKMATLVTRKDKEKYLQKLTNPLMEHPYKTTIHTVYDNAALVLIVVADSRSNFLNVSHSNQERKHY